MNEKSKCGSCGSINTIGMSRIVGYYSTIEVWNGAKQSELKDRQLGCYDVKSFDQDIDIVKVV